MPSRPLFVRQTALIASGCQTWHRRMIATGGDDGAGGPLFAYCSTLAIFVHGSGGGSGYPLLRVLVPEDGGRTLTALAWCPRGGGLLASASLDGRVMLWDARPGGSRAPIYVCLLPRATPAACLAWMPSDGCGSGSSLKAPPDELLCACEDGSFHSVIAPVTELTAVTAAASAVPRRSPSNISSGTQDARNGDCWTNSCGEDAPTAPATTCVQVLAASTLSPAPPSSWKHGLVEVARWHPAGTKRGTAGGSGGASPGECSAICAVGYSSGAVALLEVICTTVGTNTCGSDAGSGSFPPPSPTSTPSDSSNHGPGVGTGAALPPVVTKSPALKRTPLPSTPSSPATTRGGGLVRAVRSRMGLGGSGGAGSSGGAGVQIRKQFAWRLLAGREKVSRAANRQGVADLHWDPRSSSLLLVALRCGGVELWDVGAAAVGSSASAALVRAPALVQRFGGGAGSLAGGPSAGGGGATVLWLSWAPGCFVTGGEGRAALSLWRVAAPTEAACLVSIGPVGGLWGDAMPPSGVRDMLELEWTAPSVKGGGGAQWTPAPHPTELLSPERWLMR